MVPRLFLGLGLGLGDAARAGVAVGLVLGLLGRRFAAGSRSSAPLLAAERLTSGSEPLDRPEGFRLRGVGLMRVTAFGFGLGVVGALAFGEVGVFFAGGAGVGVASTTLAG